MDIQEKKRGRNVNELKPRVVWIFLSYSGSMLSFHEDNRF